MRFLISCIACLVLADTDPVPAQLISKPEQLQIKLVTIDPGDELTMWWGHTAVIVEDTVLKTSAFYNYGLFSFDQENFFFNFAMGRLIFWVGSWNTARALQYYKSLNRGIRIQTLDLSPQKRLETANFLAANILPENREYLYHHYLDNCATRVRDLLDTIVEGRLKIETAATSRFTFRDHTRIHTDHNFIMDWILMFLMNDTIDREITQWDDMFLPSELEKYVGQLVYTDENGMEKDLVKSTQVFYSASGKDPLPAAPPAHWPQALLLGIIMAGLVLLARLYQSRRKVAGRILLGIWHSLLGVIFGIPGTVLFFMSLFTDHSVTFGNENLFLANPLTLLLVPLGIGLARDGKLSRRWLPPLVYFLTASGLLLLLLKLLPAFDQFNWLSIALIQPVLIALAISWLMHSRKST